MANDNVFEFSVSTFDLPNGRGQTAELGFNASPDIAWSMSLSSSFGNMIVEPLSGVGPATIRFTCKADVKSYLPNAGEITANGSYTLIDTNNPDNKQEDIKVKATCILAQETKYLPIIESASPINNSIALTLQDLINNTPCCADLVSECMRWVDNNLLSYLDGIVDKGISPVNDLLEALGSEGDTMAMTMSFLNGGIPSISPDDLGDLTKWLEKLLDALKLIVKFSTMTIAVYAKTLKQLRAIVADLIQYLVDVPKLLTERLLGGGCRKILERIAPGLVSLLDSLTSLFESIAKPLEAVLDAFDKVIALIKDFIFDLGGNKGLIASIRDMLNEIRQKLHYALSPLDGCESIVYRG